MAIWPSDSTNRSRNAAHVRPSGGNSLHREELLGSACIPEVASVSRWHGLSDSDFAGAVWRLPSGGNRGQSIFGCEDDRLDVLALLAEAMRRFHWLWKDLVAGIHLGGERWRA